MAWEPLASLGLSLGWAAKAPCAHMWLFTVGGWGVLGVDGECVIPPLPFFCSSRQQLLMGWACTGQV